jgi:hypothetical protein
MSWRWLYVHYHTMLDVNQVIRRISEERWAAWRYRPARKGIG